MGQFLLAWAVGLAMGVLLTVLTADIVYRLWMWGTVS